MAIRGINIKSGASWLNPYAVWVNNGGVWTSVKAVYVNNAGVWNLHFKRILVVNVVVSVTQTQTLDLWTQLAANGYDGQTPVNLTVTINPGVYLVGSDVNQPALRIPGGLAAGSTVTLINQGVISGRGGIGGNGGGGFNGASPVPSTSGGAGGDGMWVDGPVTVYNYGFISGGGGGGAGGAGNSTTPGSLVSGLGVGGGGGGGGRPQGLAGQPNSAFTVTAIYGTGFTGNTGTYLSAGAGGQPAGYVVDPSVNILINAVDINFNPYNIDPNAYELFGGNGGDLGQPGANTGSAWSFYIQTYDTEPVGVEGGTRQVPILQGPYSGDSSAFGGPAGSAIVGAANINWAVVGSLAGAVR